MAYFFDDAKYHALQKQYEASLSNMGIKQRGEYSFLSCCFITGDLRPAFDHYNKLTAAEQKRFCKACLPFVEYLIKATNEKVGLYGENQ